MKSISVVTNARLQSSRVTDKLMRPFADSSLIEIALEKLNDMDFFDQRYLAVAEEPLIDLVGNYSNVEVLKVFVTPNCGENWAPRKTISGSLLSSTAQNSSWTPTSQGDWTTVHMTNITSAYWTDEMRTRFEFKSDGGNNIYLDDINIYSGTPSDEIVTASLGENGFAIEALSVFPNPTENDLNIRFSLKTPEQANLIVQDVTGKIAQSATINATEGSNLVLMNTADLASGMYFLKVQIGGSQKTIQFVVK